MKYIMLTLCLAAPAMAQPYDPTDPTQVAACIAHADDTYALCLGVVCHAEDPVDLIRLVNHCRGVYEHMSVCCSGFAPEPETCPEFPL